MKKITAILALMLITFFTNAQKVDTIIKTPILKSYFSLKLREPVFVAYTLVNGGGDCSRAAFAFHNDTKLPMCGDKEYSHSGCDKGHLANSEDFANNCTKDELTFRYYNCLPQTPNLNRGIWKEWETKIRKESHSDSLYVICGGTFKTPVMVNGMQIPNNCWKVVYSLKTKKLLHCLFFTNAVKDCTCKELTLAELETYLGYKLPTP